MTSAAAVAVRADPRTTYRVRPFVETDIPQVAALHRHVWGLT